MYTNEKHFIQIDFMIEELMLNAEMIKCVECVDLGEPEIE